MFYNRLEVLKTDNNKLFLHAVNTEYMNCINVKDILGGNGA